jgi:uncharacterized protein with ParB-like and HNH nuclease domain
MKYTFSPQHIVVIDLFGAELTYLIPAYQRPYSWDSIGKSERNNQINVMWEDLYAFFEAKEEGEYFMGSMVMIDKGNRVYEVIDGQQRLISMVLLFAAIKCFLVSIRKEMEQEEEGEEKADLMSFLKNAQAAISRIIFNTAVIGLTEEKKVRIEKSAEFNYDDVLQQTLNCEQEPILPSFTNPEQQQVAQRYFNNRNYFESRLRECFLNEERKFDTANALRLNAFTDFLQKKLSLVRITATDFEIAYQIFEILNNRGLPLSNKDLLRNFIIREFDRLRKTWPEKYKDLDPAARWISLETELFLDKEFIGRWVETLKASKQRYSAFNELMTVYEKEYKETTAAKKIESFYADLVRDLGYYRMITQDETADSKIRNRMKFIKRAGNVNYSLTLMIALFRTCKLGKEPNADVLRFLKAYERTLLYTMLVPRARFSSAMIYDAIKALNQNNFDKALQRISLQDHQAEETAKALRLCDHDNNEGKLLICKYLWREENISDFDMVEQVLDYEKATLEHIMPIALTEKYWSQTFSDDFYYDYRRSLGNMTLLTTKMNSAAKNYPWDRKREVYDRTQLSITRDLAQIEHLTEAHLKQRNDRIVEALLKEFSLV